MGLGKKLPQNVVDGLRVGLAARGAHDLADEKLEDAFFAGFELGYVIGIFLDDFAGGLLESGFVDLGAEAFGGNDIGGRTTGVEHGRKNFFADGSSDFALLDKF